MTKSKTKNHKPNLCGGMLYKWPPPLLTTSDNMYIKQALTTMVWIQWIKGKSGFLSTDYRSVTYTQDHPLFERLNAVYDVLVVHSEGNHVKLTQEEWDALALTSAEWKTHNEGKPAKEKPDALVGVSKSGRRPRQAAEET